MSSCLLDSISVTSTTYYTQRSKLELNMLTPCGKHFHNHYISLEWRFGFKKLVDLRARHYPLSASSKPGQWVVMGTFVAVVATLHVSTTYLLHFEKTRQTPLTSTLSWCFYFAFWIIFKVLKMKINEIVKVHLYTVNYIAGITSSSSSSSSINLETTSGVLSQMIIYTCPMETSFQQTMYKC
jgi:hypothetical protein